LHINNSGSNDYASIYADTSSAYKNLVINPNGGNVGIGTTSPTARLDVRRGDADGKIAEFHQNTGYGIDIGSSQSVAYISSGYNQRLDFKTDPTSGQTERMSILANGNVSIGTQSAIDRLNVETTSTQTHSTTLTKGTNTPGIWITNSNNDNNMSGLHLGTDSGTHFSSIIGARTNNAAHWGTHLSFYTHDDNTSNINTATEKMRISGNGAVTKPNQPIGSFSHSANVNYSQDDLTSANFYSHTWVNQGNHFNASTGRFTCPVAGIYRIYFRATGTGNSNIRLRKNGSTINEAYENAGTNHSVSSEAVFSCAANDYLHIQIASGNFLSGTQHKQVTFELMS